MSNKEWMEQNSAMFTSRSAEWETPDPLYVTLDKRYNFTLDPAATHENHKCKNYYTIEEDGLTQSWAGYSVFLNPPYGRVIGDWVKKAYHEAKNGAYIVVCLIPARTDTAYFHQYCMHAHEIWFLKGRVKFLNRTLSSYYEGYKASPAPFPSMITIFKPGYTALQIKSFETKTLTLL